MGDGIDGFDEPLGMLDRNKNLNSSKSDTIYDIPAILIIQVASCVLDNAFPGFINSYQVIKGVK